LIYLKRFFNRLKKRRIGQSMKTITYKVQWPFTGLFTQIGTLTGCHQVLGMHRKKFLVKFLSFKTIKYFFHKINSSLITVLNIQRYKTQLLIGKEGRFVKCTPDF